MRRGGDCFGVLDRALRASADAAQCPIEVAAHRSIAWASATFSGDRHLFVITAPMSAALDDWLAGLPEAEINLPGHLLASVSIDTVYRAEGSTLASIEALTVVGQ